MTAPFQLDTTPQPLPWAGRHPGADKSWAHIKQFMRASQAQVSEPDKTEPWQVRIYTAQDVGGQHNYRVMLSRTELREIGPGIACAYEEPNSFALRIAIAAHRTRSLGVLGAEAARWVYEGGKQPTRFTVYYQRYETRPQGKYLRALIRRVHPQQIVTYGNLRITSPEYTAKDLELDYPILAPLIR